MKLKKFAIVLLAIFLIGCENTSKQDIGTIAGAAIGGALASNVGSGKGQTAAIIGGTMLGAMFGNSIGASLDKADMMYANRAQSIAYTAPIGEEITWVNPDSRNSGAIVPTREGNSSSGAYCREFQQSINIGGETQAAYGTACMRPDGSWEIVNQAQ